MDTMTIQEAMGLLGKSDKTLRRWIASGKLPAQMVGFQYVILRRDVDKLKEEETRQEERGVSTQRLDMLEQRLDALERVILPPEGLICSVTELSGQVLSITEQLSALRKEVGALQRSLAVQHDRLLVAEEVKTGTAIPAVQPPRIAPESQKRTERSKGRPKGSGMVPVPADLPTGTIPVHMFAEMHLVHSRTLRDQIVKGIGGVSIAAVSREKKNRPGETDRYFTPEQQRGCILFWEQHGTYYSACHACPHE